MVCLLRVSRSILSSSRRSQRSFPQVLVVPLHPTDILTSTLCPSRCAWQSTTTAEASTTEQEDDSSSFHPTDVTYSFSPLPGLSPASREKVDTLFQQILFLDMVEVHLLTQLVHTKMGGQWQELAGIGSSAGGSAGRMATRGGTGDHEDSTDESVDAASLNKDVKLLGFDPTNKIKVIKEVRAIAGLGLKEAKELVESAPKVISKQLSPEKAQELKERLEAVGAQVELE